MASESTSRLAIAALTGFGLLVVLLVALVVSEENLVGSAAGVVAIVTGVLLGLYLIRTEPGPDRAERDPSGVERDEPGAATPSVTDRRAEG